MDKINFGNNGDFNGKIKKPFSYEPKYCFICKLEGEKVIAFYYSLKNYYCLKHREEAVKEISRISNSKSKYVR